MRSPNKQNGVKLQSSPSGNIVVLIVFFLGETITLIEESPDKL